MQREEIYRLIVEVATLSQEHRAELKAKRGFDDTTIDLLKFRSAGTYLQSNERLTRIPEDVSASLFFDNILIPYLNIDREPYHLRPHKFGFKGAGIRPYIPHALLPKETPQLVIAESEFKAVASCLMGMPAVGVPGISSFSRTHLAELVDTLRALDCKEAIICFDNEIKDDPAFPNFKADFTRRYDTQIYSYIMAAALKNNGIKTRIAMLKDSWRVQGKADIDGVLAQGIDPAEYQACIANAVEANEFRKSWKTPSAHKPYVERRVDRFFYGGPIDQDFDCYYIAVEKGGRKRLTNFTITILHTLYSSAGAERYCQLKSTYGTSSQVIVTPEIMVSKAAFQKFCFELGDFEFFGNDQQLGQLWSFVMLNQDGRSIRKLKSYGYDDSTGIWFFSNSAYWKGTFCPAGDDGIVWVDDVGYLLPKLADGEKDQEELMVPTLDAFEQKIKVEEVAEHFSKIFHPYFSKIILGWALGNFFMPEILKYFKVYPFLFFYGKQQSGKSTIANYVSSFFGFLQKGIPYGVSSTAGISRAVGKLSMIPVWLEEYRNKNDPILASKNNMLRSIYDKSTIVKGTKRDDEIKTYRARSTLIISGEEYPQDAALNSRCMLVPVFRHNYSNSEDYYWMATNAPFFNQIGHHILILKEELWPRIRQRIQEYIDAFEKNLPGADSRSRIHHAVVAGVIDTFVGRDSGFEKFLAENVMERTVHVDKSQAINVFLDDLVAMYGSDRLNKTEIVRRVLTTENGKKVYRVAFWLSGAYMLWETMFKGQRNDIPATKMALVEHMKSEGYFITMKDCRINAKVNKCLLIDEDHNDFPIQMRMILASIDQAETNSPFKPDTYDSLDEIERPHQQEQIAFGDKVVPFARGNDPGAPSVG